MIEGRLGYNQENGRYGIIDGDFWENDGLHCGETLEILVEDEWIPTRIEKSWDENGGEWYVVGTPFRGHNLEYIMARQK